MALKSKSLKIRSTNNRLLFILGLVGVAASVLLENSILWVVALVIALTGLFNADTWTNEKGWLTLTSIQRRSRLLAVLLISAVLLAAVALYFWIHL